jgi:hypothetical protein
MIMSPKQLACAKISRACPKPFSCEFWGIAFVIVRSDFSSFRITKKPETSGR